MEPRLHPLRGEPQQLELLTVPMLGPFQYRSRSSSASFSQMITGSVLFQNPLKQRLRENNLETGASRDGFAEVYQLIDIIKLIGIPTAKELQTLQDGMLANSQQFAASLRNNNLGFRPLDFLELVGHSLDEDEFPLIEMMEGLLRWNPNERLTTTELLSNEYFQDFHQTDSEMTNANVEEKKRCESRCRRTSMTSCPQAEEQVFLWKNDEFVVAAGRSQASYVEQRSDSFLDQIDDPAATRIPHRQVPRKSFRRSNRGRV
uniref:Protein kinase domain-containing protein n=1 Tax=Chromera velia CCMP2878 TaxID=1169474 RepID=A0A0G4FUC2_9ALVE|eukprot:Cvel_3732.t1-p1 / transcript=Cvel_3732.t1 / gene=Cvel_3732 / organism=Chromera_velia_CCMP2878 / gene_product=hypothetical protein / transcript_product=hypothetical protein / location=Cvel_scaffold155:67198-68061(+) / protein_length=259 / sequence_SO=supercontig / SO=protein_coding / is_pseudo=false